MKLFIAITFLLSFFNSVNCFGQILFPDSIPAENSRTSNRIKGTRLLLTIPSSYKVTSKTTGVWEYQKDSTTGIEIVENVSDNFFRLKDEFSKSAAGPKNHNTETIQLVSVGNFNGLYRTDTFEARKQKSMFLVFGDSSFAVIIAGTFQQRDTASEIELINILKTAGYDKSLIADPFEFVHFTFDLSITGFKYVPLIGDQELTYSPNGILRTIEEERHTSSFEIGLYKSKNIGDAEKITEFKMKEITELSLSKLSNIHCRNKKINGHAAYEITLDERGRYVANSKFYIVIIQKENKAALFWGVDRDGGKWLEKFKTTVRSIKF